MAMNGAAQIEWPDAVAVGFTESVGNARSLDVRSLCGRGTTLVVAPHPDDESLGCGGLAALLAAAGEPVWALLITDGALSHPNSLRFDAAARAALRQREWHAALDRLGIRADRRLFLGLRDGDVPGAGDPRFGRAARTVGRLLFRIEPALVVLPWRRDPHTDHRATHALVSSGIVESGLTPRCLEYTVWTAERAARADLPGPDEMQVWRLDIDAVVARKRLAIAAHRSQLGEVIDDDPGGFTIAPAMRRRAEAPREYFFEERVP